MSENAQVAAMVLGNAVAASAVFGGIALCVRFDQRGKTRRRELEHTERLRAIELGWRPDDAAVAHRQAAGAVGVGVPIASLSAAVIGSCFGVMFQESPWLCATFLAVVWLVCGAVGLSAVIVAGRRLREPVTPATRRS